jgi:ubiquinone biosynthesis UbiH/UbiF/VisC/COQ6 family hydroxylase
MGHIRADQDVIIIGAGPAGLSLARSLAGAGLGVTVVERQGAAALADPAFDGREIALTRRSVEILRGLDSWERIPPAEISPLGEAVVRNGGSPRLLHFQPRDDESGPLGHLVPNHLIRRALHDSVRACAGVTLLTETQAVGLRTDAAQATVTLGDGTALRGRLAVAADTRFSEMRRRMGIAAGMRDFGRSMLVCRMAHSEPHHAIATEWFGHGQTLAILPLNGTEADPHISSVVITLPAWQVERMLALDADAFATEIARRFEHVLGDMRLVSTRHAYPLVAVYAARFVTERFALMGDAAVGMHPVTAHGFNFGLLGQDLLAGLMISAATRGRDIGAPHLLARYQAQLRAATRPLYLATNATALLYTDDRLPARALRDAVMRVGKGLTPIRQAIVNRLMAAPDPAVMRRA